MVGLGYQNQEHKLAPNKVAFALKKYDEKYNDCLTTMAELTKAITEFPLITKPISADIDDDVIANAMKD